MRNAYWLGFLWLLQIGSQGLASYEGEINIRSEIGRKIGTLRMWDGTRYYTRCTATLVGPNHVLTAQHCVPLTRDYQLDASKPTYFLIGETHGKLTPGASPIRAKRVWTNPPRDTTKDWQADWAIVELESAPISDYFASHGYMQVGDERKLTNPNMIGIGYSSAHQNGAVATKHVCAYKGYVEATYFLMKCGLDSGASGGPLIGSNPDGWRIVGVTAGASDALSGLLLALVFNNADFARDINVGVGSSSGFAATIQAILKARR